MSQPRNALLYNQVKAGLTGPADDIAHKIAEATKDTAYYENQKKRSKNIDRTIVEMQNKLKIASIAERNFAQLQVDNYIKTLENKINFDKTYIHADLDMFFAAVEALLDPSLKGTAFAVGGSVKRGIISTSSYEARKFGVRSGMAVFVALKLCPDLKIVHFHGDKYHELSQKVKAVFAKYDPNYVSFGLDEATLDITELVKAGQDREEIARKIQREVFEDTQLTISIGVAHTQQLAKIASDINKPNGIFLVPREKEALHSFIASLPIRKIPGIGGVTEQTLKGIGINTMGDVIQRRTDIWLVMRQNFCEFLFAAAIGVYRKTIEIGPQQSISKERTFDATNSKVDLMDMVENLAVKVCKKMVKMGVACRTVTLKLKNANFQVITRAYSFDHDTNHSNELINACLKMLLDEMNFKTTKYRLLGVRASALTQPGEKKQTSIQSFINKLKNQNNNEKKEGNEKGIEKEEDNIQNIEKTNNTEEGTLPKDESNEFSKESKDESDYESDSEHFQNAQRQNKEDENLSYTQSETSDNDSIVEDSQDVAVHKNEELHENKSRHEHEKPHESIKIKIKDPKQHKNDLSYYLNKMNQEQETGPQKPKKKSLSLSIGGRKKSKKKVNKPIPVKPTKVVIKLNRE